MSLLFFIVFFFKQKTAYEMRISDWSSDVCSSDLFPAAGALHARPDPQRGTVRGMAQGSEHGADDCGQRPVVRRSGDRRPDRIHRLAFEHAEEGLRAYRRGKALPQTASRDPRRLRGGAQGYPENGKAS